MRQCSNCKYYAQSKRECRFSPPQFNGFPRTEHTDWCRMFQTVPSIIAQKKEPKKITWKVNRLQEVDLILVMLHLHGDQLCEVVMRSKANKLIVKDIYDLDSWDWLKKTASEHTWNLFVEVLKYQKAQPFESAVNQPSISWAFTSRLFQVVVALAKGDKEVLERFGFSCAFSAMLPRFSAEQVIDDILAESFRGYWNMRLKMIPGSRTRPALSCSIVDVTVTRLDAVFLFGKNHHFVSHSKQ